MARSLARTTLFLTLALVAASCGRRSLDEIVRPDLGPSTPVPPLPVSTISLPVTVDLRSLAAQVETAVPREQRASGDWTVVARNPVGDFGIRYEAWREPLTMAMSGDQLNVEAHLFYWLEAAQRVPKPLIGGSFWQTLASCGRGEPPRAAVLALQTTLAWSPDWRLLPATVALPASYPNKCRITFLKIDVTDKVDEVFAKGMLTASQMADQAIATQGNLRPLAERVWRQLQEPVMLDSGVWLAMSPATAAAAPIAGQGMLATTSIMMTATPSVSFGARPAAPQRALPKLEQARPTTGFQVAVDGEISFDEATRQLARAFRGKRQKVGGREVTVEDIRVFGSGDMAVLELHLSGDLDGTLYLAGRPVYDDASGALILSDLDYSLETGQMLARAADWLYHGSFRETIAQQARMTLTRKLGEVRQRIERSLNRVLAPGATLVGKVGSVRPVGVYVTPKSFRARVAIDGTLRLDMK